MRRLLVLAVTVILFSATTAHADTILDAQSWWDAVNNSDTLPPPTKKAPLYYGVFPYAADECGVFEKKRVDKITSKKPYGQLVDCLHAVAGGENAELTWAASDLDTLLLGFDDATQAKKIRKALKKLAIVSAELQGGDAPVHFFFALDKKGNVRGVFMYVDAAG